MIFFNVSNTQSWCPTMCAHLVASKTHNAPSAHEAFPRQSHPRPTLMDLYIHYQTCGVDLDDVLQMQLKHGPPFLHCTKSSRNTFLLNICINPQHEFIVVGGMWMTPTPTMTLTCMYLNVLVCYSPPLFPLCKRRVASFIMQNILLVAQHVKMS